MSTTERLTEPEMVDILEEIARQATNQAARIAAIKQLRDMRKDRPERLDDSGALDELAARRPA